MSNTNENSFKLAPIEDPLDDPLGDVPEVNFPQESDHESSSEEERSGSENEDDEANEKEIKTEECDICGKAFSTAKGLRSHKIFHFRKKSPRRKYNKPKFTVQNFKCKICVYGTQSKFVFRAHMEKHEKQDFLFNYIEEFKVRCEQCGAPYRSQRELDTHVEKSHPEETTFECNLCESTYLSAGGFRKHYLDKHPEVAESDIKEIIKDIKKTKKGAIIEANIRRNRLALEERRKEAKRAEKRNQEIVARIKRRKAMRDFKDERQESEVKNEETEEKFQVITEAPGILQEIKQEPEIEIIDSVIIMS